MLGAVATRIAAIRGNVVGLEVLERDGGVAIDDLMIELPSGALVDELCAQIQQIDGAGVEDVHVVGPGTQDRGLQVVAAAISILDTANPTAALTALMGLAHELFDADWAGLADLRTASYVQSTGDVPSIEWLAAFVEGARSAHTGGDEGGGSDDVSAAVGRIQSPSVDGTEGSGVLAEPLSDVGLTLALGRATPFRRRERWELEMLVRVTDRACRPVLHSDRIPPGWGGLGSSPRIFSS